MKTDFMFKRLLFIMFFSLSVNSINAQWNFDFKPPKERIQQTYKRKKIRTKKVVKPLFRKKTRLMIDEPVFYEPVTDSKKLLEDFNDYQLEIESSKGNVEAQYLIGSRKIFSEDSIEFKVGMEYLKLVAEEGNIEAMALLGFSFELEGQMDEAADCYIVAADKGNALGEYRLALLYSNGDGCLPENQNLAAQYFLRAAHQGVSSAQVAIAIYLFLGLGVSRDLDSSEKWMKMAAENGEERAIQFLQEYEFNDNGINRYINKHKDELNLEKIEVPTEVKTDAKKLREKSTR